MPSSTSQLFVGIIVALAMAVASVGIIDIAVSHSSVGPAKVVERDAPTSRHAPAVSETEFRLSDHQSLRRIFLGN